jgi:hypothetical protein
VEEPSEDVVKDILLREAYENLPKYPYDHCMIPVSIILTIYLGFAR